MRVDGFSSGLIAVFSPSTSSTSLSLTLDDRRQEARYFLGETIAGHVTLPRLAVGKLIGKRITFTSSAPEAVAAPAPVFVRTGTTSVPISVTVAGQSCVVLTATTGGQTATTVFRTEPLPG